MGAYLSSPITELESEEGELHGRIQFGVASMQGWRRSMEDEHIATALSVPEGADALRGLAGNTDDISMFGVWDGHGGHEVAQFVRNHMAKELVEMPEYRNGQMQEALVKVFHRMDEMLWQDEYVQELQSYKAAKDQSNEPKQQAEDDADDEDAGGVGAEQVLDIVKKLMARAAPPLATPAASNALVPLPGTGEGKEALEDRDDDDDDEEEQASVPPPSAKPEETQGEAVASVEPPVTPTDQEQSQEAPESTPLAPTVQRCALPNVKVMAGCTSVVALVVGQQVIVANAGDSRAVLCRGGTAVALSEDHKPNDTRELRRIQAVGGFVNMNGRVNGNLNLSRSIGDLKYKQSQVPPAEQMITAEPDLVSIEIGPQDEFLILACDGIWDCLSNQGACDFVRTRLLQGKTPKEIAGECCHHCLAEDPHRSGGIGADNMTMLIATFKKELNQPIF